MIYLNYEIIGQIVTQKTQDYNLQVCKLYNNYTYLQK
jgi:hypothetical protein